MSMSFQLVDRQNFVEFYWFYGSLSTFIQPRPTNRSIADGVIKPERVSCVNVALVAVLVAVRSAFGVRLPFRID
jgi:hypothetical protein